MPHQNGQNVPTRHGNVDDAYWSEDSDDEDRSICLQEMLGGITFPAEWKEEEEEEEVNGYTYESSKGGDAVLDCTATITTTKSPLKITPGLVDPVWTQRRQRPICTTLHHRNRNSQENDDWMFQYAFTSSGCGTSHQELERPPLQIFDFGKDSNDSSSSSSSNNNNNNSTSTTTNKGKGLIATQFIRKGNVIYTERAAVAIQMPKLTESLPSHILACQYCFRSLESWTKLLPVHNQPNHPSSVEANQFPFPELWPVLPLDFFDCNETPNETDPSTTIRADRYGRIQCQDCQALFCSQSCYREKRKEIGSCCLETRLQSQLRSFPWNNIINQDKGESPNKEPASFLQAPVMLAAVLFLHLVQYYRTHEQSLEGHWYSSACGTAEDLQLLELGQGILDEHNHQTVCYTLAPLYHYMTEQLLNLDDYEKETLSSDLLHSLAAKCARNGVSLCTQSPFKPYYSGLLRKANYGGRQSEAHTRHMQQLAAALGKDSLYRGMDRDIEALVAPEISGFFPLTAYCNHSCQPNAQIQSQEFADAHIDIVAIEDIVPGQEVFISYIGRTSNKFRRQKELRARYLFHCECERCLNEVG